ncbi:RNA polymerase I termination factor [Spathaspora sp. JA1]|nr:RNA polymerase I termination factor [Spathaspora sp. JA1]
MEGRQQEIGGAHALLQLGSKTAEDDIESSGKDTSATTGHVESDEEGAGTTGKQGQITDAVEAAVMRFVGGTLDSANYRKQKRKLASDDYDFNQWTTGFLSDNLTQEDEFAYANNNKPEKKRKKKKSKKNRNSDDLLVHDHMVEEALNDARELAEHDQLVEDAMKDARELQRQDEELLLQQHDDSTNIPPHQAQQILAAANAVVLQDSTKSFENIDNSKFNHLTTVDTLVENVSSDVMTWYNSLDEESKKGPRRFSPEEQHAVDHFIAGYCHMNKWNRQDVCNRIWSNDRKKDNFWESLTRILPYRSRSSVYKHIRRQYHVFDVRAQWTKPDDELLRKLALTHEGKWKQIGEIMGRMPEDCRDRWRNYVKCGEARTENKWTEQEEEQLKSVVNEILTSETQDNINWTIVSERMKGSRSRIQCRYKWAKLIKREANMRSSYMSEMTKSWLIRKVQQLNVDNIDAINWDYLVKLYQQIKQDDEKYDWQAIDFKVGFEKLKMGIKDHRRINFKDLLDKLVERYNVVQDDDDHISKKLEPRKSIKKTESTNFDDPATIANAAVAAVSASVDEEDTKHQEYSLWR